MQVRLLVYLGGSSVDAMRLVALVQRYPVDEFLFAAVPGVHDGMGWEPGGGRTEAWGGATHEFEPQEGWTSALRLSAAAI